VLKNTTLIYPSNLENMIFEIHPDRESRGNLEDETCQIDAEKESNREANEDPILCPHCLRTASNGLKCKGICVADSDY
jgi:hypothetical protein